MVRDTEALDRLAKADVLLLDHHPALEATEPEVASVRVFPGHTEFQVLRYAASALRDLDDERAPALRAECLSRRIALLDRIPTDFGTDVTLHHRGQVIKVGNLGGQGPRDRANAAGRGRLEPRSIDSLMVGINGQIAGLIDFRPSARLRAATALQELRTRHAGRWPSGLVSEKPATPRLRAVAAGARRRLRLRRPCHRRPGPAHPRAARGAGSRSPTSASACSARAARQADVAISLDADGLEELERNPASILLLQPDLSRLGVLGDVSRVHRRRILSAQGGALLPNLFCVAGAFFLGFSSLTTVMITNLGTGSTYARTASRIRRLERQLARSPGRRAPRVAG